MVPGPAVGSDDVAENKVDRVTVLREFTFQWGSQKANNNPIVISSRTKINQGK